MTNSGGTAPSKAHRQSGGGKSPSGKFEVLIPQEDRSDAGVRLNRCLLNASFPLLWVIEFL